jgi:hypothetical protein
LCYKPIKGFGDKKIFCLGACFLIFLEKIKKQAPKHHFISPPKAAKYFLPPPEKKRFYPSVASNFTAHCGGSKNILYFCSELYRVRRA